MKYKRLKEKLEAILTLPELPFEEDLTAVDCKIMYDILCKIEQGTLIELPCKIGDKMDIAEQAFKAGFKEGVNALRMLLEAEGDVVAIDTILDIANELLHPQGKDGKVMKWGKFER